jgi:hypothetical protein
MMMVMRRSRSSINRYRYNLSGKKELLLGVDAIIPELN